MTSRTAIVLCSMGLSALPATSCTKGHSGLSMPFTESHEEPPQQTSLRQAQSENMSFADRYMTAMADVYDRAQRSAKTPQARLMAQRCKILAGIDAMSSAVDLNPIVGLMDMAVMVTINRELIEEPWATELFGAESVAVILSALKLQEADIWSVASSYLTADQISELHQLAKRWRVTHPDQQYVSNARLTDFPEARSGPGSGGGAPLAGSVFSLLTLNPFSGLKPAVREVEESRILAERMFFYLQHMPVLVSWQADSLYDQMLMQPQMQKLFTDTSTVASSTSRFADATSQFANETGRFADTVEKFREQLPQQQSTLVEQMNELIARQRDAALKEATAQVSIERDATIQQLNTSISTQQDAMTRNLQVVMDQSIDRLYLHLRSLVLFAAGSLLAVLVLYRVAATVFTSRRAHA